MRMSASRIRSINRSIARVNGIICGASDGPRRIHVESSRPSTSTILRDTTRIVAVPKRQCASERPLVPASCMHRRGDRLAVLSQI
jgi:hypothetical protein